VSEKILFVDDDPNILNAFKRQLRKQYKLETASSGKEGLVALQEKGPFSVIVADMRMPEMDGVTFLKKAQEASPDSVRLMLTGNADQQTAIDAVNEGNVFRFLNKPCPLDTLVSALDSAQAQYRLIHTERELLEGTLNGSIELLLEILSIVAPTISGQAMALRETAVEVARSLRVANTWEMEMATMLSHIAYVTLPPETLAKTRSGEELTTAEQQIVAHLPETGHKLLNNIPRLKTVADIVLYQRKNFDGSGIPDNDVAGEDIPIESRILKILHDLKEREQKLKISVEEALEQMQNDTRAYDPRVLQTVAWFFSAGAEEANMSPPMDVGISELRPGQVLVSNVETDDGRLLFAAGQKLSAAIVERLLNYHHIHKIKEPIQVSTPLE
jgi:response regulator RpfG family c-di-GMP phosphodiesterase